MDYFIFTINRNRLFPSFVASFFALFLSASYGPCFVFSLSVCADQVILLCASVARSSHVHVPLSLSISLSFFLCSFSSLFFLKIFISFFEKLLSSHSNGICRRAACQPVKLYRTYGTKQRTHKKLNKKML